MRATKNRSATASSGFSKLKKKSSLRLSFGPGEMSGAESEEESHTIFTPKKSTLSRQAIEKNALRKSLSASGIRADRLPSREGRVEDRPSYSRDYLAELKSSTPTTPKDLQGQSETEEEPEKSVLDIVAKFGTPADAENASIIPSEAEIQEKKERRARLAKEQQYISVNGEEESSLQPFRKHPETRLVHEDEDIAEGFDEFVDDGGLALGKKLERQQAKKRRKEMAYMIEEAENSTEEDTDDSEAERKVIYEAVQTRAGAFGPNGTTVEPPTRPRTPPKITPISTLAAIHERMKAALESMQKSRAQKVKALEELTKEKEEISRREEEIQRLLKEAGEKYEHLREEAGLAQSTAQPSGSALQNGMDRGLESIGNSPLQVEDQL